MIARRPRRILHVEANQDGTVGGSHRALYDLVTRLDRDRYEPHVLFYQENPYLARLQEAGIAVHLFEQERARELVIRRELGWIRRQLDIPAAVVRRKRLLDRLGIDMVHLNNSPAIGSDDWMPAARLRGIPIVAFAMTNAGVSSWVHRVLLRGYEQIIACSDHMRNEVAAMGVPRRHISRVYLGTDVAELESRLTRSRKETRAALGVSDDELLLTMVGNIRPWKGQHVLIEALGILSAQRVPVPRVLVVGATAPEDAMYEASLLASIESHGLAGRVSLTGPRDDVPDIFNAADIAVHASLTPEPFGLVIVEAMALGAVVVAAAEGGSAEIVASGTGLTFDPHDPAALAAALIRLLNDPDDRSRLSAAGRERAALFSVDAFVEGVETVYEQVF